MPKPIYKADGAELAKQRLEEFDQSPWGRKYPAIAQSWRRNWEWLRPASLVQLLSPDESQPQLAALVAASRGASSWARLTSAAASCAVSTSGSVASGIVTSNASER
jgi:hypothetical protein